MQSPLSVNETEGKYLLLQRLHWDALRGLHVVIQRPIEGFVSTIVSRVGKKSIQSSMMMMMMIKLIM